MPSKLEQPHKLPSSGAPALVADLSSRVGVVVTHPFGPLGGNMHNNVVSAAVLYFQKLGITTLRFDFVGSQIGRGNYQVQQVVEAAEFLLTGQHITNGTSENTPAPSYILLVGYSYGSLITGSASAKIPQCVGCISISPPFTVKHWLLLFNSNFHMQQARKRPDLPRLIVIGTQDNFTSEAKFREMVDLFPTDVTTGAVLKGADHFFVRREKDLMEIIGQWLVSTYPACHGDLERLATLDMDRYVEVTTTTANSSTGSLALGDDVSSDVKTSARGSLAMMNCAASVLDASGCHD